MSLLNISGMSFGALSPPAIHALNAGAKIGGLHTTPAKDPCPNIMRLAVEILFGRFRLDILAAESQTVLDPNLFEEKAASDQVKMSR